MFSLKSTFFFQLSFKIRPRTLSIS